MAITIIVEDDTGLATANSYSTEDEFLAYHTDRGVTVDTYESEQIRAALAEGTIYLDLRWGSKAKSKPLLYTQALEFPRLYLTDKYGIQVVGVPDAWKQACMIYALMYLQGTLYNTVPNANAPMLSATKTVIGPITTEKKYATGSSASPAQWKSFPLADNMAKQYTASGTGTIR